MIYIVTFCISGLFATWAMKYKAKKNRWLIFLLSAISILVPSTLGGIRATSMGTDIQYYVISHFNFAKKINNMWGFLTTFNTDTGREPLYRLIVYLVSLVSDNIHFLLFVFQFLTILFIYIGIYKHKNECSVLLVLFLFFFLFYNDTYNLVRQYLAMAIIFANIDKLERKDYKHFMVWIFVATLIHATAIISIGLVVVHYIIYCGKLGNKLIREIGMCVGIAAICIFFSQIVRLAVYIGLLSSRYLFYFENDSVSGNNLTMLIYILQCTYCSLIIKKIKNSDSNEFYFLNSYVILAVLLLGRRIYYGNRISFFFTLPNIIFLGKLSKIGKSRIERLTLSLAILFIAIFYWCYLYIFGGVSQTYPYIMGK